MAMKKFSENSPPTQLLKPKNTVLQQQAILVIDDSPDTLLLQRIMLESEGFKVFTAQSGTEGLALLSKIKQPNLILLDMQMGDMTGIDFLNILEKTRPEIIEIVPVVFLTGMDEVPKSNAVGFIRKPADMDKFLSAVHGFIAQ